MTLTITLGHVLLALLATIGGAGGIGALIAAGILQRWVRPAIRAEIVTHEGESATVEARKAAIRTVLDDQVARDDGIIRRHTREHEGRLSAAIEAVRETSALMVEELAQMRGVLAVMVERIPPPPERGRPTQPHPLGPAPRRPTPPHGTPR